MASSRPARSFLLVVMDLLVAVAAIDVLRMLVEFIGQLAREQWGKALLKATVWLVLPLGLKPIPTPYGGSFAVNAAVTVLIVLAAEWALGIARRSL